MNFARLFSHRAEALDRTRALFELGGEIAEEPDESKLPAPSRGRAEYTSRLAGFLSQGAVAVPPMLFILSAVLCGIVFSILAVKILSAWFLPIFFVFGAALPWQWAEARVRRRAAEFSDDYPTMLLAAASSMKVGLTPYQALERATKLLPAESLVRIEVKQLIEKLQRGIPRETAVREFAQSIRQPDIELFRSAFLLVLENGGRFSPTLLRLAAVGNNRSQLIRSAAVSTASMRMTANVLLVVAPVLVLLLAARTENYWDTFFNHPVANVLASTGIVAITGCYAVLRSMSNFKP